MKFLIGQNLSVITLKWLKKSLNRIQRNFIVVVGCFCLLSCQNFRQQEPIKIANDSVISLNGTWEFLASNSASANYYSMDADYSNATPIKVPGNWFSQGYTHHGVAWYKKNFKFESLIAEEEVFQLVFEGVDYFADVWLNGHYLGFHEGYFQSFQFDISALLKQGENSLVVRVNSPLEDAGQSWSLHKKYIKGVLGHHDTRPGGAWSERGQERNTGGIWQSVSIEKSAKLSIDSVKFTPQVNALGDSSATINLELTVKQSVEAELNYQLLYNGEQVEQYKKMVRLTPNKSSVYVDLPESKRHLWSPWEHGNPNMYQLKLSLVAAGKLLSRKDVAIAFRDFKVLEPSGEWQINSQPFFVRGTNYIAWQWLAEFSAEDFAKDLKLMKAANINAVRVHAHVLPQAFYQEADKLGMIVWQDFPLQWGYVDTDDFLKNAQKQAKEMVEQFYNHPSIVVWSAHNEPPWDADWMKYKYKDYSKEQNKVLDEEVYKTLQLADNSRYSHKSSLTAEHPWLGWYSGSWLDYAKPTKQRWITEFGAQALPIKSTLEQIVGTENLWPKNKKQWAVWDYHNFQQEQTFNIAKVDKGNNINEFIDNTQKYQMKLTAFAAESYRRQKGKPVNAIFQFMFVEDWASMNWGIVDYKRKVKPGYESLKTAYQPLLPSIEYDPTNLGMCCNANFSLWLINDYPQSFDNYQLKYQLIKGGKVLVEQILPKNILASSSEKVTDLALNALTVGTYQLRWLVMDDALKIISENSHHWSVASTESDLVIANE